jgi:hypothetical protein
MIRIEMVILADCAALQIDERVVVTDDRRGGHGIERGDGKIGGATGGGS